MSKTIKVGDDTHAELEDRKRGSKESFDDVIRRELGDGDSSADIDVEQLADELTTAVSNGDPVTLEATEYRKIADEVEGRLQR